LLSPHELDTSADDAAAVRSLLRSGDARDVRLGLDLLAGVSSPAADVELWYVAEHAAPDVRMRALALLAAHGDDRAAAEAAALVRRLAHSADVGERRAAAGAFEVRGAEGFGTEILAALLLDDDVTVRAGALDAVATTDGADPELVRHVVSALGEPRLAGAAGAAVRRLGAHTVPALSEALATERGRKSPALVRAAAAVAAAERCVDLAAPVLEDDDRTVVLAALEALDASVGRELVPTTYLERTFEDAAEHAAKAAAARHALSDVDSSVARALDDEIDLARRLVVATLALRYGDAVREAVRVVDHAEGARRALGVEALDVLLTRAEASVALPLVRRDPVHAPGRGRERSPEAWLENLAEDPTWRSEWLAVCARHASARR
jgi:hypothetical protein